MQQDDLCFLSAVELAAAIRAKKLSPVELVSAVLDRIDRIDPALNAYCTVLSEGAKAAAKSAEAAVMQGEPLGPLHGVPISVKDNLYVKGVRTTFGSKLFEHNVTQEDAPGVERLRNAGAIFVGRTNSPEFGWKGVTDNRVFGITRNPWNPKLTPGGSSGGASAAVATGMGPVGIGTDGGGSLRIPASFCNVFGFKPSFGRVPNYPAGAGAALRHIGPITRTVADAALSLNAMAGPDERDLMSLPGSPSDYLAVLDNGIKGLRIGFSPDLGYAKVDPDVARVCQAAALKFRDAGAVVEQADITWGDPYECWAVFFFCASTATLEPKLALQGDLLDPGLRSVVEEGIKLRAVDYVNAVLARDRFWQSVRATFEKYDLLLTPTLAVPPFPVGQDDAPPFPGEHSRPLKWTRFTYPFNLTGQPVASVPCGWTSSQLPVGLQIIGRRFDDQGVLQAARAWEQIQPWADRRPPMDKATGRN